MEPRPLELGRIFHPVWIRWLRAGPWYPYPNNHTTSEMSRLVVEYVREYPRPDVPEMIECPLCLGAGTLVAIADDSEEAQPIWGLLCLLTGALSHPPGTPGPVAR